MSDKKKERLNRLLSQVTVILVNPKYGENVGAAARVACNMGISQLALVRASLPDQQAMEKMATHHARHLLTNMTLHPTLAEAIASCNWVVASTARRGRQRTHPQAPHTMATELLPLLANNKIALVFGPEQQGLTNDELALCNSTVSIATSQFSSLNLAQSVGIICHELFTALWQQDKDTTPQIKIAPTQAVQAMYSDLETTMRRIGYLADKDYAYWMHNLRQFFNRVGLRAKEVRFIHGLCRQVNWLTNNKDRPK